MCERIKMIKVRSILEETTARVKKMGKPSNILYAIKALVELGKGWHSFKQTLEKMIEISNNPRMKNYGYYAIQDVIKKNLADVEARGTNMRDYRVRLKDEVFDEISECIDEYTQRLEKYR